MTKPKTAATLAALQRGARIAREAQRVKRASATARLLAEPMPAEFHALTCDCGATFVVGPREAATARTLRCSMCRAEAVRAAMGQAPPPLVRWWGPVPAARHARDWTEAEVDALAQAYRGGCKIKDLPAIAGHPQGSCATKVAELIRTGVLKARMARHPRTEPPAQRVAA